MWKAPFGTAVENTIFIGECWSTLEDNSTNTYSSNEAESYQATCATSTESIPLIVMWVKFIDMNLIAFCYSNSESKKKSEEEFVIEKAKQKKNEQILREEHPLPELVKFIREW